MTFMQALIFVIVQWYAKQKFPDFNFFAMLNPEVLKGVKNYLDIGIPSTLMMSLEWWVYELIIILAGYININDTGAMGISYNIFFQVIMPSSGIGVATNIVVGWSLGANSAPDAKIYCLMGSSFCFVLNLLMCAGLIIYKNQVTHIFTMNNNVVPIVEDMMVYMTIAVMADSLVLTLQGALKALGYQIFCSKVILIAFYLVCIPMSYILAFPLEM